MGKNRPAKYKSLRKAVAIVVHHTDRRGSQYNGKSIADVLNVVIGVDGNNNNDITVRIDNGMLVEAFLNDGIREYPMPYDCLGLGLDDDTNDLCIRMAERLIRGGE